MQAIHHWPAILGDIMKELRIDFQALSTHRRSLISDPPPAI